MRKSFEAGFKANTGVYYNCIKLDRRRQISV